ncbi:MAG: alpha/beta hydrolase [Spirobacillus cienkowskii]|uniref:Alpha/beta hydrolase n=1 Tax=Spirobacillus cienkowskii TaxID=495820 RepID=A0A369KPD7_9BACT|nr:MAG: alpha/beta hydrolase [Spirobacillus cienkowskii]
MTQKNLRVGLLSHLKEINKFLNLKYLQLVAKPAGSVEDLDVIKDTEVLIDRSFSIFFKKYLNANGFKSKTVATKYGQMHYYDSCPSSKVRPLVFVHGLGSSAQSWWILANMLKNKKRILIPDLFHMSGFSEANNAVMNLIEHAESLIEFIQYTTKTPIEICGLSMGGWLSMHIAANKPQLIHKMILLNPAGLKVNPFGLRDTLAFLSWQKFQKLYPGILKAFPYSGVPILSHIAKRSLYRNLTNKQVKILLKLTNEEHFVDDKLKDINCPVLLLWGKEDALLSNQIPIILTKQIPKITAKWVENCAHVLALEAPAICFLEINQFLKIDCIQNNSFAEMVLASRFSYPVTPILEVEDEDHDN